MASGGCVNQDEATGFGGEEKVFADQQELSVAVAAFLPHLFPILESDALEDSVGEAEDVGSIGNWIGEFGSHEFGISPLEVPFPGVVLTLKEDAGGANSVALREEEGVLVEDEGLRAGGGTVALSNPRDFPEDVTGIGVVTGD